MSKHRAALGRSFPSAGRGRCVPPGPSSSCPGRFHREVEERMAGPEGGERRLAALQIDRSRTGPPVRQRRRRLLLLILALVLGAAALLFLSSRPGRVEVAEVRQARPGEAATVLSASGYVSSKRRSILAPQVAGRLIDVLVDEGDTVQEGQIVARLDPSDANVAVLEAEAQERNAAARVKTAAANLTKARRDLERTRRLAETGAVARATLQDAETARQAAESELTAARGASAAARQNAEAAALRKEHTEVRAPFDGTVVRKIADEGAVLAPAAITAADVGGIIELVDLKALEVDAEVSEDQLRLVEPGMPVLVFLDAFPDKVWRGSTGTVRPAIDKAKATAVVKVGFDTPPQGALPDMGARVSFLSQPLSDDALQHEARLRVPATAVVRREEGDVVFTVEGGRAVEVPVKVAGESGGERILERGPPPGTPIVANPPPWVRGGDRLKVEEAK